MWSTIAVTLEAATCHKMCQPDTNATFGKEFSQVTVNYLCGTKAIKPANDLNNTARLHNGATNDYLTLVLPVY